MFAFYFLWALYTGLTRFTTFICFSLKFPNKKKISIKKTKCISDHNIINLITCNKQCFLYNFQWSLCLLYSIFHFICFQPSRKQKKTPPNIKERRSLVTTTKYKRMTGGHQESCFFPRTPEIHSKSSSLFSGPWFPVSRKKVKTFHRKVRP